MKKDLLRSLLIAATLTAGSAAWAQTDVTGDYLTNADLSSLEGWSYGDNGYNYTGWNPNMDVPVIEFYHTWGPNAGAAIGNSKDFHFTQTVTLPAGNYRIAVNAFYREGNGNGTNTKAYIFAGEQTQYVHGLTAAEQSEIGPARSLAKVNSDMGAAAYLFSKGRFSNAFDFDVETETTLELGFRGYIDTYCSWCILGPVKLYKYSLEDYLVDYRARVAEAQALLEKPMSITAKQTLQDAIVEESTFQLSKQVTAAIQTLNEAINAAKASISAYEKLGAVLDNAYAFATEAIANGAPEGSTAELDVIKGQYEAGTIDDADVDSKIADVDAILIAIAKQQTKVGSNMTSLLVNPDFERSASVAEGWTIDVPNYGSGNAIVGGNSFNHCFEAFNNPGFDVYQVVAGAPVGVYEIEVQGFYRYLRGDNAWYAYQAQEVDYVKRAGVPVYIYMNNNATPFTNVFDVEPVRYGEMYSTDAALLNPGNVPPYVEPSGQYWYPNEMYNSALAFSAGMYKQSAFGLVARAGDELRLGVKGVSNQGGDSWVIWDNFKLVYRGFDPDVIKPVLEDAVEDIDTLYMGLLMGKTQYAALTNALVAAANAIANNDGEGMFNALNALYDAKDPARESKDIFLAQEVAADTLRLAQAIRNVEGMKLANSTKAAANELQNGLVNNLIYENDEIDQLKTDVTEMINRLTRSVNLYANLSNAATELKDVIKIAEATEYINANTVSDAKALLDAATKQYDEGTIDDDAVPGRIDEINDMIERLHSAIAVATGIEGVSATAAQAEGYTLGGLKAPAAKKGIVIMEGKKVVK